MYREMPKFKSDEVLEYLRKSRSDDPDMSVEEVLQKHETILSEWIARNLDAPIPIENVYREIVSGETIEGRPEVQKMLKRIESPKIKAILVVEVQRLSRGDLEDCGRLIKLLRYTQTMVITPHKIYDLEDEYDRDAFERELKRGNEYLEYYKKIQKRGIMQSISEGNYLKPAPFGYENVTITIGKKKCPTLAIREDEAEIVRMIFDWYGNEGIGAERICHRLIDMGIKPRKADKWCKSTILKMLNSETYIGKVREGTRTVTHKVIDQEIVKKSVYHKTYTVHDGKHPAIIDEELFYKIKNKRGSLPKHKIGTELKNPYVSIIRCECGSHMECKFHRKKWLYVCANQTYCNNTLISLEEVNEAVVKSIQEEIANFSAEINADDTSKQEQYKAYISTLRKRLLDAEKRELSLWDKYTDDGMPKSIFDKLLAQCLEEKKTIEDALEKAYSDAPKQVDHEATIVSFHEAIEAIKDDSISASAKNKLLTKVIERISLSRPRSIRLTPAEALERGVKTRNGWYTHPFTMDIHFRV